MGEAEKSHRELAGAVALGTAANCPQILTHNSTEAVDNFRQAMQEAGIQYSGEIIADGRLHRFHVDGHRPGTCNGAYKLHLDGMPAGWFQDFKTGISQTWRAGTSRKLSHQEIIAYRARVDEEKRQRELERHNRHQEAAAKAAHVWSCARSAAEDHPYLAKKKIQPHGVRQLKDALCIPLHDESERLVNLQFITADGRKRFLSGGKKQSCYFTVGDLKERILICEGYATGCSLHQATGDMVVIAFDAGNLLPVAQIIRKKYNDISIIVCGDNDLSGVGQKAANEAAAAIDGLVLIPPDVGTDWNDQIGGRRYG